MIKPISKFSKIILFLYLASMFWDNYIIISEERSPLSRSVSVEVIDSTTPLAIIFILFAILSFIEFVADIKDEV